MCICRDIWLDKIKFSLDGAVGHYYGSTFVVKNGQMHKIQKTFKEAEVLGNYEYSVSYWLSTFRLWCVEKWSFSTFTRRLYVNKSYHLWDIGNYPGPEKGTDNRDLHDLDSNQKLSREDIEKMKKEGAKGEVHV